MRVPAGPIRVRPLSVVAVVAVVAGFVVASCSGGDEPASVGDGPTTTLGVVSGAEATTPPATDPGDVAPAVTDRSTVETSAVDQPDTTFAVVEVPETGVPGLDSDDAFCAAWSRFGGSWQVIQVAANFAPDPAIVPTLEVIAAPVVAAAYDALFAAWPDELADERATVADGFFGPLDRRAETALDALDAAGATSGDLAALGAAWEAALADRQPGDPVVAPDLSAALGSLVVVAAADLDSRLAGFVADPSMVITVETPRTDAYLATACPDQGALTGAEVEVEGG
jgi:hypothetical protein